MGQCVLLPSVEKLLEYVICIRLLKSVETANVLSDYQILENTAQQNIL